MQMSSIFIQKFTQITPTHSLSTPGSGSEKTAKSHPEYDKYLRAPLPDCVFSTAKRDIDLPMMRRSRKI
jgi:hypothetical protein